MKHDDAADNLVRMLDQLGIDMPLPIAGACIHYLRWLLEANRVLNLTAISDLAEGLRLHLADSLTILPELSQAPEGELLDLGTGGGLPGVPLALATGRQTTLLDSIAKKAAALDSYVKANVPSAVVVAERAEEHALTHRGDYAVVVARAVASLPALVELAAPLLQQGGWLISLKGRLEEEESTRGDAAASLVGLTRLSSRELLLPGSGEARVIVVYERTNLPQVDLPRRPGRAQRKPLA